MQRYFIKNENFKDNLIKISEKDFHHIKNVMRFKIEDEIIVVDYNKHVYLTKIKSFNKNDCFVEIVKELDAVDHRYNLTIAQALIKRDNFELVLQKVTELGVSEIMPLNTKRSIIKINDFSKKKQRYETIVKEASEQSERITLPTITNQINIMDIDYSLYDLVLVAYARNELENNISKYLKDITKETKVIVLIGPEGGFSKDELKYLESKAIFVSLGNTILRSETAAIYIASIYRYQMER